MAENELLDEQTIDNSSVVGAKKTALTQLGASVSLESVYEIPVEISVVLGKTSLPIESLLRMGEGAIIELKRKVGEPVDVYVNGRIVARGEIVIVEDKIGITMTEIIKLEG